MGKKTIVWVQHTEGAGDNNNRLAIGEQISDSVCYQVKTKTRYNPQIERDNAYVEINGETYLAEDVPEELRPQIFIVDDEQDNQDLTESVKRAYNFEPFIAGHKKATDHLNFMRGWEKGFQLDLQITYGHLSEESPYADSFTTEAPSITYDYMPTRVNSESLKAAKKRTPKAVDDTIQQADGPVITLCIGDIVLEDSKGKSTSEMQRDGVNRLLEQTKAKAIELGASVLIATSPRTSNNVHMQIDAILERDFAEIPHHYHQWSQKDNGNNPYLSMLAHADHIVVTADSLSMTADALATDASAHLFIAETEGIQESTPEAMLTQMQSDRGDIQPFPDAMQRYLLKLAQNKALHAVDQIGEQLPAKPKAAQTAAIDMAKDIESLYKSRDFKETILACQEEEARIQAELAAEDAELDD